MKKCPFCKKLLNKNAVKCKYCGMIIAESFRDKIIPNKKKFKINLKVKLPKIDITKFKNNFKKIFLILFIALIYFGFTNKQKSVNDLKIVPKDSEITKVTEKLRENYNRLPNGNINTAQSYQGLGILKISNGTSYDAVVKLINSKSLKAIYYVYINENTEYEISNIPDGEYIVLFQTGKDWDGSKNTFEYQPDYIKFRENLLFETKYQNDFEVGREWNISLNPTITGTAKTDKSYKSEFDKY